MSLIMWVFEITAFYCEDVYKYKWCEAEHFSERVNECWIADWQQYISQLREENSTAEMAVLY